MCATRLIKLDVHRFLFCYFFNAASIPSNLSAQQCANKDYNYYTTGRGNTNPVSQCQHFCILNNILIVLRSTLTLLLFRRICPWIWRVNLFSDIITFTMSWYITSRQQQLYTSATITLITNPHNFSAKWRNRLVKVCLIHSTVLDAQVYKLFAKK